MLETLKEHSKKKTQGPEAPAAPTAPPSSDTVVGAVGGRDSPGNDPDKPFDPGPIDPEQEPDLCLPLNMPCCVHLTAPSEPPPPQETGPPASADCPQPPH